MSVQYRTPAEKIEQRLSGVISRRSGGFVLCNFSHTDDLLFGIDALRSFNIPINEVYSPARIDELKSKLEIKRLKAGHTVLKYGCIGGASLAPMLFYALDHNGGATSSVKDIPGMVFTAFFLISTFFLASWLTTSKPPEIIKLPPNDRRFLIVIKTRNIMPNEKVASFLQYSGSVEITQAVKKLLLT